MGHVVARSNLVRRIRAGLLGAAAFLPLAACGAAPEPSAASSLPDNPHADARFLQEAPIDVLQGETFAKLAEAKAYDPDVRAFAVAMEHDDAAIGQQLAPKLHARDLPPPDDMSPHDQIVYHQIEPLSGRPFDRAYIGQQMQDQTLAIELFQAEADSGKQPELQSLARDALPVLQQGLQSAVRLSQDR